MRTARVLLIALVALAGLAGAQTKKRLTPEEYVGWESLGAAAISNDGKWVASQIGRVEKDGTLIIRSSDGPEKVEVAVGSGARFSDDSKWVAYSIGVPRDEAKKLQQQRKPVRNKLGIRELATGKETVIEEVASWAWLKGGKTLLALHHPAEGQTKGGNDLEIVRPGGGANLQIGNVAQFAPYRGGRWVALAVSTAAGRNSIQLYDEDKGTLTPVHTGADAYRNLTWARDGAVLAFLAGKKAEKKEGDGHTLVVVSNPEAPAVKSFGPADLKGVPEGFRIVEFGGLSLSDTGASVVFGVKKWEDASNKPPTPADEKAGVEVWNTQDTVVMPLQKNQANQERNRHHKAFLDLANGTFTVFDDGQSDGLIIPSDHRYAYVRDGRPYASPIKVGGLEYADAYSVDLRTGVRRRFIEKGVSNVGGIGVGTISPGRNSTYCAYYDARHWWIYDARSGEARNATASLGTTFEDPEDDNTIPQKPAAGFPVWAKDGSVVFLHDAFDVFAVPMTGAGTRVTNGRSDAVRSAVLDLGLDEDGIRVGDPLYLSLFNTKTKASGIGVVESGTFKQLAMEDAQIGGFTKSKDTDRLLFRMNRFDQSPSLLLTNLRFEQAKPLAATNPQQKDYHWGKSELLHYKATGRDLQATLIYPADYDPNLQYPMVVYIYERLSDGLHSYIAPNHTSPYNQQHFSQAGYFVLMPDIAYRDRNPGLSAVECLETAVGTALRHNRAIDGKRVGLTGHSWGGYQTVFVAMKSKMFHCFVAGAPLTELTSMYNSFYWNWGQTNQVIFESSQGRMAVPWWEDWKAYWDNSPLFHAGNIAGPMLVEAGTVDGAVDWHQSQYLYNTLRRMGKNMVLLVYEGENHGLAREPNMKDYAKRARHFFDVYLKGTTPEDWVSKGVPFIKQADGK